MKKKVKKINVESLSEQELKIVEETLTKKINEITTQAINKANKHLNVYGFEAIMAIQFKKLKE